LAICERLSNVQAIRVASFPRDPSSTRAACGGAFGRVVVGTASVVLTEAGAGAVWLTHATPDEAVDEAVAQGLGDFPEVLVATPAIPATTANATMAAAIPSALQRERRVTFTTTLGEPRCLQRNLSAPVCHKRCDPSAE
jgi:hypothetical protein